MSAIEKKKNTGETPAGRPCYKEGMDRVGDVMDPRTGRHGRLTSALFAAGVLLWVLLLRAELGSRLQWILAGTAAVACAATPVRRHVRRLLDLVRTPSKSAARWTAAALSLAFSAAILVAAYAQDWDFVLRFQDEHSYALQLRMLAEGRLWMPPLDREVADFLGSLNLLAWPKYGSMYFPGTALLYVPGVWLRLPFWVLPALAGGACVGLTYVIFTDLVDGAAGWLGALLLASLPMYRGVSLMLLSQTPTLLLGLLLFLMWLKWRREQSHAKTPTPMSVTPVLIGALSGWLAITRPLDALCFVLPVAVGMLAEVRRAGALLGSWGAALASVLIGALPFLGLQALQNKAMTGRFSEFPIDLFHAQTYPAPLLGFYTVDWPRAPVPKLAEDRELMETSAWPLFRAHTLANLPGEMWRRRLPLTFKTDLPTPVLATLLPLGLLGLTDLRRRLFVAIPALFVLAYASYIFYQGHYLVVVAPGIILLAVLGARMLAQATPRHRTWVEPVVVMALVGFAIGSFAQADETLWSSWLDLARVEARLAALPREPAIVLFRYHPYDPTVNVCFHEPVYNIDAAWPDDATLIRAHDLGAENARLFHYYAARQPNRVVYLYDRADDQPVRLGTVSELARAGGERTGSSAIIQSQGVPHGGQPDRAVQKNGP